MYLTIFTLFNYSEIIITKYSRVVGLIKYTLKIQHIVWEWLGAYDLL